MSPDDDPSGRPDADDIEAEERLDCWRCGLSQVPAADGKCRRCQARIAEADEWPMPPRRTRRTPADSVADQTPVVAVVVAFGIMLLVSVVWGWVLLSGRALTDEQVMTGTAVLEAVDTILVLAAFAVVGRPPCPDPAPGARGLAWALAVPAFGLLIGANVLYAAVLQDWLKLPGGPPAGPLDALTLVVVCLQPALVEELFFRYVAFGVLRRATGLHATVWVTGVMFAAAHIYNPLGMPYLFVAGLAFGYFRAAGGLALPMILHFFHNLAVLLIEGAR